MLQPSEKQAQILEQLVTDLRRRENKFGLIELPPIPKFRVGQRVRLISGPFSGQLGNFMGGCPHDGARVLLQFLGRSTRVTTTMRLLEFA